MAHTDCIKVLAFLCHRHYIAPTPIPAPTDGEMEMQTYQQRIATLAPGYKPAQIEAFMRVEHSTLDGLSPQRFASEVRLACQCIDADPAMASRLAASFGLA